MRQKKNIGLVLLGIAIGILIGTFSSIDKEDKTLVMNNEKIKTSEIISFLLEYENKQTLQDLVIYKHLKDSPNAEELEQQVLNSETLLSYLEKQYIEQLIDEEHEEFNKEYQESQKQLKISYYATDSADEAQDIKMLAKNGHSLQDSVLKVSGESAVTKITRANDTTENLDVTQGVTIKKQDNLYYVIHVDQQGLLSEEEFKKEFVSNKDTFLFAEYLKKLLIDAQLEWNGQQIF